MARNEEGAVNHIVPLVWAFMGGVRLMSVENWLDLVLVGVLVAGAIIFSFEVEIRAAADRCLRKRFNIGGLDDGDK